MQPALRQKNEYAKPFLLGIGLMSFLLVVALFFWLGHNGLNLGDEGFLWYGAQRTLLGEVPLRDFMSYDPGRYYWVAAVMAVAGGNGIICLRAAVSIFQFFGLFCGLYLVGRSRAGQRWNGMLLLGAALVFVLWMFPRHKIFDISISIFLIGVLARLAGARTLVQYFLAGVGVGLAAFFGRNHGLYGFVASLGLMVWLRVGEKEAKVSAKGVLSWCGGIFCGYGPMLLLMVFVPGFFGAFAKSLEFQSSRGSTNFPLPIPWPWRVDFSASFGADVIGVLTGILFISLVVFGVVSLLWIFVERIRGRAVPAAFAGAAFLALPYAHFAYSRADMGHLAQGIFPLLVGCLVLISNKGGKVGGLLLLGLIVVSFMIGGESQPGWGCVKSTVCEKVAVDGSKLRVDSGTARNIDLIRDLAKRYSGGGRAFVVEPYWPGAYALLGYKSPFWANYALWKRGTDFEKEEVERMKAANPGVVVIIDLPLDGREELRFRNTNPFIYDYVVSHFQALPGVDSRCPPCQIYVAKDFPGSG